MVWTREKHGQSWKWKKYGNNKRRKWTRGAVEEDVEREQIETGGVYYRIQGEEVEQKQIRGNTEKCVKLEQMTGKGKELE